MPTPPLSGNQPKYSEAALKHEADDRAYMQKHGKSRYENTNLQSSGPIWPFPYDVQVEKTDKVAQAVIKEKPASS